MAQKFVSLDEAAERLGVSKDRLNQLREAGRARAFRDGASWKFKPEEVDRLAGEGLTETDESDDAMDLDLAESSADDGDSILLSDPELVEPPEGTGSTIIGPSELDALDEDSDLTLKPASSAAAPDDLDLQLDSGLDLSADDAGSDTGSDAGDLELESSSDLNLEGSDLELPSSASDVLSSTSDGSGVLESGSSSSASSFEHLDELETDLEGETSEIGLAGDEAKSQGKSTPTDTPAESSIALDLDDASNINPSETAVGNVEGSSIELAADEDDELVLGEGSDSDITLGTETSGISLVDASDTGLALDGPLDLGGSVVESLELGEEEPSEAEAASASAVQTEDDFSLTPTDEAGEEEEDSGSQVIALDGEADVDDASATILGTASALGIPAAGASGIAAGSILEEDLGGPAVEAAPAAALGAMAAPSAPATFAEPQYSTMNIVSLTFCVLLLALTGMMTFDVLRNVWSFNEAFSLNSAIMDTLLSALP